MSTETEQAEKTVKMTVEHIYHGSQPRAYADHQYEAIVTYEAERKWLMPLPWQVEAMMRVIAHDWDDSTEPYKTSGTLIKLEQQAEEESESYAGYNMQRWHCIVTTPYFD